MTTPSIEEVARRVEAATGPDRELDADIQDALKIHGFIADRDGRTGKACGTATRRAGDGDGVVFRILPRYTGSLDAAVSLVGKPEQPFVWSIVTDFGGLYRVRVSDGLHIQVSVDAATPALALTAAALRARADLTAGATHDR